MWVRYCENISSSQLKPMLCAMYWPTMTIWSLKQTLSVRASLKEHPWWFSKIHDSGNAEGYYWCYELIHQGRMMHLWVSKLGHHWFRLWLVAWSHQVIIWTNGAIYNFYVFTLFLMYIEYLNFHKYSSIWRSTWRHRFLIVWWKMV